MKLVGLIILGVILALIVLIMLIPIGADVAFEQNQLTVSAKVCGVLIKLLPRPPKDPNAPEPPPKVKKPKKEKPPQADKPKKKLKLSFTKEEIFALIKKVMQGLGKFRKMRIDRFKLHLTVAGSDPYNAAMLFGYVNGALSALAPLGVEHFHVDDCDIYTELDYSQEKLKLDFGIALSIRIGQIFAVLNTILFGALGILIKNRLRLKKEARLAKKTAAAEQQTPESEVNTLNTEENSQPDERNE